MEESELDYNLILENCGLGKESADCVVKNIIKLEEFYDKDALISINRYIFKNIKDIDVLILLLKSYNCFDNVSLLYVFAELLSDFCMFENNDFDKVIGFKIDCAKTIAKFNSKDVVDILLNSMNNKNEHYRVRLACADALGRVGSSYAVPSLLNLVQDDEEKSIYLKESATFALGTIGDTTAIDPLISLLESKHAFWGKFAFLKEKIVEALGKLNVKNNKVLNALKNSLSDSSPMVRINAIEAIMNSGDEESFNIIKPSLHDEDCDVQKNAMIALYNLVGRSIVDEIISLPSYSETLKKDAQELLDEYEAGDASE